MQRYLLPALAFGLLLPATSQAACCYFSAKNADILQPAQKVFINWDPVKQLESFTVQPRFEGKLADPQRAERRELGWLDHHGVAGGQRRREAPARDRHGEVPGHDHPHDSQRLVERAEQAGRRPRRKNQQGELRQLLRAERFVIRAAT